MPVFKRTYWFIEKNPVNFFYRKQKKAETLSLHKESLVLGFYELNNFLCL